MSSAPAPSKPAPRPGPKPPAPGGSPQGSMSKSFNIKKGVTVTAQKTVIYGPGGVGKTELASLIEQVDIAPLFIDLEMGTQFLDVARVDPSPETFEDTREAIRMARDTDGIGAIAIDSFTKLEELAASFTIRTVKHEKKDKVVNSIEDYGFGKGYTHVFESFLLILQELDAAHRAGKSIIAICHECTASVPNPSGEDWIRYEPRLQSPASGKASIRHRVKEWCDHLLFIGYDTFVNEDGKASGGGSRAIYPTERPTHMAKNRAGLVDEIQYTKGSADVWRRLFGK